MAISWPLSSLVDLHICLFEAHFQQLLHHVVDTRILAVEECILVNSSGLGELHLLDMLQVAFIDPPQIVGMFLARRLGAKVQGKHAASAAAAKSCMPQI